MRATPYNTPPRTHATSLPGLVVMLLGLMTLFAPWDALERQVGRDLYGDQYE